MTSPQVLRNGIPLGALAGLVGGLIFVAAASHLDRLPMFAPVVRADSPVAGLLVILVASPIIGSGFGALVWQQRPSAGGTFIWGLAYGTLWWYLGTLTLLPLSQGKGVAWDLASAQAAFPDLLGAVLYGAGLGLT